MKVSVVIPVYQPDKAIFRKVKDMLRKQTIKAEILEIENLPEAIAMNTGIKKSKGDIIIILDQDCIPDNEKWIENLIAPFKDKNIIASQSDISLPYWFWKKRYGLIDKVLTVKERRISRPLLDARGTAYRKSIFEKIGYFEENPKIIAIDNIFYMKLRKKGKIAYPGTVYYHCHPPKARKRFNLEYKYAEANGSLMKIYGRRYSGWWRLVLKAVPFLGLFPLIFSYPIKRAPSLFPIYLIFVPFLHILYISGFLKGFYQNIKISSKTASNKSL